MAQLRSQIAVQRKSAFDSRFCGVPPAARDSRRELPLESLGGGAPDPPAAGEAILPPPRGVEKHVPGRLGTDPCGVIAAGTVIATPVGERGVPPPFCALWCAASSFRSWPLVRFCSFAVGHIGVCTEHGVLGTAWLADGQPHSSPPAPPAPPPSASPPDWWKETPRPRIAGDETGGGMPPPIAPPHSPPPPPPFIAG